MSFWESDTDEVDILSDIDNQEISNPSESIRDYYNRIVKKKDKGIYYLDDLAIQAGFQPELDLEFPTEEGAAPRIPHIIHQVFLTSTSEDAVPAFFLDNVKTYFHHNPNWTYFFWTNTTARAFLADRHPSLLEFYDNTNEIVVKGDMLRYVLLYEFGGLFADLDTVNHRPLDVATTKYPCILVPEPFEHAVLWYYKPFITINAIMLCRPKHPFFQTLIDSIPSQKNVTNIVYKLGPGFLTNKYRDYSNLKSPETDYRVDVSHETTSPYFYKGDIPAVHEDGIYIPNTRFFMDSPSPEIRGKVEAECRKTYKSIPSVVKRLCLVIAKRGYFRNPGNYTFLTHLWSHTWSEDKKDNVYSYVSVSNVTAKLMTYSFNKTMRH